jgi:hypothetical protein
VELLGQLFLPLLGQMGRTENGQALDLTAIQEFPGDERSLDSLADADVIGDEQAHRVELERHHQRHELVRPRLHRDAREAAERAGSGASGEPGGFAQQATGAEIADILTGGESERGRFDRLDSGQDADDLLVETTHRAGDK